ncbi:MAG: c-type cytochrome [Bacteroidota bacterium]|nr:c-type cytochrome [Bacteroidota bacterium]MDP4215047.1 c-type cytochrome [Bacteroidota bacterium]MDP4244278.1 c-type cytochrome [Bacteroidota bacterium]MDP4252792.1 c-type cytochrome [Bacteroidota bacterium]MDP4257523.1 c-type cytochrome [Bacteroidota bacterium]
MDPHQPTARRLLFLFAHIVPLLILGHRAWPQDGKALFQSNCAQCHNPVRVITGPALKGVTDRVTDRKLLHDWIHNNQRVLASGNAYFNNLYDQYGKAPMNTFPELTDPEIDAILKYVNNYSEPMAATNTSANPSAQAEDHSVFYGIATFILALFSFGLYLVNANLKRLALEKRGLPPPTPIPFYRRKFIIALTSLVLCVALGVWIVQLGVGVGRSKGYQPVQPIFFSHHVHAGLNQISCLFCHGNAWESKVATVPSLNVCMNCHATITEYKGERLEREDGTRVDPNEEIKKLYAYAGYDPGQRKYTRPGKAVEWIKIHNLPDHVFFSHAQHVRAGKIQCQTCHGPVQEMNEVRQFADLSMGWCINCHRSTRVDFPDSAARHPGNRFYTSYGKYAAQLRSGTIDSVTVEEIGGTECQKCHY